MNILITGVSKGIGLGMANYFLSQGHSIVGVGRSIDVELKNNKAVKFYQLDMLDQEKLSESAKLIGKENEIDLFIHNAMYTPKHKPFLRYTQQDMLSAHGVCSVAPTILLQRITGSMRSKNFGRIIFIGSLVQEFGARGQLAYLTAKSALDGLTLGLSKELGGSGVTVNQLRLGPVKTEKFDENIDEARKKQILELSPNGVFLEIEEIVQAIEFLSTAACESVNGSILSLQGGIPLDEGIIP